MLYSASDRMIVIGDLKIGGEELALIEEPAFELIDASLYIPLLPICCLF